ncbi:hypothetical protein [Phocaeicola sartorii]|uniref:hypothetical protein n=1 Tax=Phocaeicola sartorii TaxID=671267 RepID=UPI0014429DF2|nr:hypothetical protein [Phocaeicola sartorii]
MENGLILFRKDKDIRAGKERVYHYVSGEFRAHPEAPLKTPATEFCKTAATATTLPTETTMDRASQGVVAPPFFMRKKGLLPPLLSIFIPKRPEEGEDTGGGGGPNDGKRRRVRTDRNRKPDRQNGA